MNLLAIETSTDACSVALLAGTELLIDHRFAPQQHGTLVLPMIDKLMADASLSPTQLDGVVFGRGPGSFTGVRICVALTQGIALGADVGVVGISTMQSVAQGVYRVNQDSVVAVSLDARMDEVYYAAYQVDSAGLMSAITDEVLCAPEDIPALGDGITACWAGSGAERYSEVLSNQYSVPSEQIRKDAWPHAQDLISLATPIAQSNQLLAPEQAMPIYLRNKVAETTEERALKKKKP